MENIIGGLNYNANLAAEDRQFSRDLQETEMIARFLLTLGGNNPQTGIVDTTDPVVISSTETTRPGLVTVSQSNPLEVKVNPVVVVTKSGAVVSCLGSNSFKLSRVQENDINVVFAENEIIPDGNTVLNDYQDPLQPREIQNPDNLRSALLTDWNNVSLFPPTRKTNIVVLAIPTTVATSGGGLENRIDLTNSVYAFNRPWFSPVDISHRAKLGSGVATDKNPHAIAVDDLSTAGNVALLQGISEGGIIVSRDTTIPHMVGAQPCSESVPFSRIKVDTGGTITAKSPYGGAGARYVELLLFPTRLGSIYNTNPAQAIAGEVIQGTNLLVFGKNETIDSTVTFTVEYTSTQALQPPIAASTNLMAFGQPLNDEIIVANRTRVTIADPTYNFEGSGPFPRRYRISLSDTGNITAYPQIIVPVVRLDDIGTAIYQPPRAMQFPARISIGLTLANNVPTMSITMNLYGKDLNGNVVTEAVTFSVASGYVDEAVPSTNYDAPNQLAISSNIFSSLDNIQIISRQDDGPSPKIQIWAEIEPGTSTDTNDYAKSCQVLWNGQGVANIEDERLISRGFTKHSRSIVAAGEVLLDSAAVLSFLPSAPVLNQTSAKLFTEDFEDLRYFDSHKGFAPATGAIAAITVANNGFLTVGDLIQLRSGKVLSAVSGTPDTTLGQFNIGAADSDTAISMAAAVNDATFNTQMTAVATAATVNLTMVTPLGTPGNLIKLIATLAQSAALTLAGFDFGLDAYGEAYLDGGAVGLKSPVIPQDSNLNPAGYYFRRRYRSRAIAIPTVFGDSNLIFAIEVHGEDKSYPSSVRLRGCLLSNPSVWNATVVASQLSNAYKGIYVVQFTGQMHKVQVEYYGKAQGLSVYMLKRNI